MNRACASITPSCTQMKEQEEVALSVLAHCRLVGEDEACGTPVYYNRPSEARTADTFGDFFVRVSMHRPHTWGYLACRHQESSMTTLGASHASARDRLPSQPAPETMHAGFPLALRLPITKGSGGRGVCAAPITQIQCILDYHGMGGRTTLQAVEWCGAVLHAHTRSQAS